MGLSRVFYRPPPTCAPPRRADRAGFSLLETIVVLAITSMLMLLIFSIGTKSTQTGFRLGRRALSLADTQFGVDATRALIQSLVIPAPSARPPPDVDGTASSLTASASLALSTPCGGPGPMGLVRLSISRGADGRSTLSCQTGSTSANLLDLGQTPAAFTYSTDGANWSDAIHMSGMVAAGAAAGPPGSEERRLLVRLVTADGRVQISELLSSGPPGAKGTQTPAQPAANSPAGAQQTGAAAIGGQTVVNP